MISNPWNKISFRLFVNTSAQKYGIAYDPAPIQAAIGGSCSLIGGRIGHYVWCDATREWECSETFDPCQNSQRSTFSIRQNNLVGNSYNKLSFIKTRIIQLSRSINIDKNTGIMDCQVLKEGIQSQIDFWPKFSSSNIFSFYNV